MWVLSAGKFLGVFPSQFLGRSANYTDAHRSLIPPKKIL
jgi:hypothetical protein